MHQDRDGDRRQPPHGGGDRCRGRVDDFLAEATPEDKLRLIRSHQKEGRLVAMTGDRTNDAPGRPSHRVGQRTRSAHQRGGRRVPGRTRGARTRASARTRARIDRRTRRRDAVRPAWRAAGQRARAQLGARCSGSEALIQQVTAGSHRAAGGATVSAPISPHTMAHADQLRRLSGRKEAR